MRLLVQHNADINAVNHHGETPFEIVDALAGAQRLPQETAALGPPPAYEQRPAQPQAGP
eukprot:m.1188142 g.1188142  ORF g.1188142 m.1188142 type:complete len:59 (+) comp24552_c0_seq14:926-1102(+)